MSYYPNPALASILEQAAEYCKIFRHSELTSRLTEAFRLALSIECRQSRLPLKRIERHGWVGHTDGYFISEDP